MVAGWMLYFVLVSALLLGAGLLLEEAARRVGLPLRWIWAGALGASTLVPVLGRFRPSPPVAPAPEPLLIESAFISAPAVFDQPRASGWSDFMAAVPSLDPILIGIWAGATGVLLLVGLFSALRLRRAMRGWERAGDGAPRILVSETTGPAVVGLFRGAIVLPRWATSGDPGVCRLMLAHEEEHLRARDPALLLAAAALTALLPWNLPLWWQLRRLRLTVEVDCDARVLRRGSDLRSYATLLMEVGRRRAGLDPALLAFAEPASFLERRIRIMTSDRRRNGWALAALLAAVSMALVAGACGIEQPTEQVLPDPVAAPEGPVDVYPPATEDEKTPGAPVVAIDEPERETEMVREGAAPPAAPRAPEYGENPIRDAPAVPAGAVPSDIVPEFSPRDREPQLRDRSEFGRRLNAAYPSLLRDAGIGGRVVLWVRVGVDGEVTNVQVYETSGYEQLDQAAMKVMRTGRFSPAMHQGEAVPVWIALPVTFQTSPNRSATEGGNALPPPPPGGEPAFTPREMTRPTDPLSARPAFTPREVEPALQNRTEFGRALERLYPAALRDAGIGGKVLLWTFIDENGRVANVRVNQSSGHPELDAAAAAAIRDAQFSPALNRGARVPVWVMLPVTFQSSTR